MERITCPYCKRAVSKKDTDAEYTVNGSKIFRTKIWYHRTCVERALTGAPRLKELNI